LTGHSDETPVPNNAARVPDKSATAAVVEATRPTELLRAGQSREEVEIKAGIFRCRGPEEVVLKIWYAHLVFRTVLIVLLLFGNGVCQLAEERCGFVLRAEGIQQFRSKDARLALAT
jgi:hypothetical protein